MKHLAVNVALSLLLLGCGQKTVTIVGEYRLEHFEEGGTYYVIDRHQQTQGGVFEGAVDLVGWNKDWLLARVQKLYQGDSNGWYALELRTRQVFGPLDESQVKHHNSFSNINIYSADKIMRREQTPKK